MYSLNAKPLDSNAISEVLSLGNNNNHNNNNNIEREKSENSFSNNNINSKSDCHITNQANTVKSPTDCSEKNRLDTLRQELLELKSCKQEIEVNFEIERKKNTNLEKEISALRQEVATLKKRKITESESLLILDNSNLKHIIEAMNNEKELLNQQNELLKKQILGLEQLNAFNHTDYNTNSNDRKEVHFQSGNSAECLFDNDNNTFTVRFIIKFYSSRPAKN